MMRPMSAKRRLLSIVLLICVSPVLLHTTSSGQPPDPGPLCTRICKYPATTSDGKPLNLTPVSDRILAGWNSRARYYLIMGVRNGPPGTREDDFAKADVDSLLETLCKQHFQPLPGSPYMSKLVDKDATLKNLDTEITEYLPHVPASRRPLLVFYYAGHGAVDKNFDNLLMLWGSEANTLEAKYSFSLREEIRKIRWVYSGDLLVILDACYSGQAVRDLTGNEFDNRTAVLASSSNDEPSEAVKIPGGGDQLKSAFTYALTQVLQGSEPCDSDSASKTPLCKSTRGGVLGLSDLLGAVKVGLSNLPLHSHVAPIMKPFGTAQVGMVGYYCEAVRDLDDISRMIEAGADDLLELLNSTPALVAHDKEAFGIVDEHLNLLATVTAYVSKGTVSTVTVDSLVATSLNAAGASNARLKVVGFELRDNGVMQFKGGANLLGSSSQVLFNSLKAQAALALQPGAFPMDDSTLVLRSASKTVVLDKAEAVARILTKDPTGQVVFRAQPVGLADMKLAGEDKDLPAYQIDLQKLEQLETPKDQIDPQKPDQVEIPKDQIHLHKPGEIVPKDQKDRQEPPK